MKSFLNIMAADMLSHFSNDMRDVAVVFPGKRAGMFLSRELAALSKEPVWVPSYCTMDDLFQSLTSVQIADPLECICQLYSVMQEVLGADYTETLDEFWSWGEVLMTDFDDIDKHLANAEAIFTNIADQERLKNLDYLDQHQRETLQRFFGHFSLENSTRLQQKFLHTWSHMYEIYTKLHERLLAEGKLWEGALYRLVIGQMQSDESLVQKLLEGKRAIVFAGFNVLNNVEHAMMSFVQREGKARFYWDYDIYYCDPKNDDYEAGYFMKQNLRDFPCAISEIEPFDNFRHLRDVTFIACTTDNAAARYVNTFVDEELRMKNEEFSTEQGTNAGKGRAVANSSLFTLDSSLSVVLCNEALMLPVLHAIPESEKEVNVTMGFPIADTPVYGIIMTLLKLQTEGYDADRKRFRYPFEQALRRQPLFEFLNEEDCFTYQDGDTQKLLDWLLKLIRQIAFHYAQIEEPNIFEQLYSEATFRCDRILCLLRSQLLLFHLFTFSPLTLRRLLRQMMTSTKIPFHSEPDRGMQVMGMLETRCLDFEHLLLLSVEEGCLPRNTHGSSFIPESLREAFGMTTQRHRIAVYAYYFYRLVQRCEHLTCVYNESTNDGVQHEMSRFLRQMLAETDIPIKTRWLRSEPKPKATQPLVVEKTPDVMERLRKRYDQSLTDGEHITLSPSAINTYKACPMQFYINNVLRIRREDDTGEGISADIIGTIFHDTAEFFYEWLQERYGTDTITADMLCERKEEDKLVIREVIHRTLQQMLHVAFDVCWFHPTEDFDRLPELKRRFKSSIFNLQSSIYKGTTLIAHDVLLRYLQALIRYDARHAPFRIIGAEKERTISLPLREDRGGSVKVGGRIDRIDEMDGRLRIVDYKTGSYKLKDNYIFQIFLYALAELERGESTLPIQPVLFFPIKASQEDYNPSIVINKEVVDDFARQHAEAFRESLQEILNNIFDPDKPFTCTTDPKACEYCKLGLICGKARS
ncbi:MAG: PD-(D/E)XK nuclease family protein [Bacteroidaceae bacterium]|nr:PD-(D/E)XK nuclease family protein [Bacteroidaceae bacterium]